MRDLFKILVVGIILFFAPYVNAEQYKVVVLPDNIVTDNETVDAYIYNATSEFFANEIVNILDQTDYIEAPTVSEERKLIKNNPSYMIPARNLTNKFRTSYNIDYLNLQKIANASNARYVLLLTSTIDAENYVLRRTVWDFLNIPGATVIDPAYKISTYAVLVDTEKNTALWSNTFYKTISVCENRIITRGPSPQTEQLQKIRDYSRMICPEIAQNVQEKILPPDVLAQESKKVYYDMGNFDNTFTKKYRRWSKEGDKVYQEVKKDVNGAIVTTKDTLNTAKEKTIEKYNTYKGNLQERNLKKQELINKQQNLNTKLEVKAEPSIENSYVEKSNK